MSIIAKPEPLITFDSAATKAAILNYNLPASTAFTVKLFLPVDVPDDYWKDDAWQLPSDSPYVELPTVPNAPATPDLHVPNIKVPLGPILKDVLTYIPFDPGQLPGPTPPEPPESWAAKATEAENLIRNLGASHPSLKVLAGLNLASDLWTQVSSPANISVTSSTTTIKSTGRATNLGGQQPFSTRNRAIYDPAALCNGLAAGKLPIWDRTFYGRIRLRGMVSPIKKARPQLYVIQELEIATFLGDYGAGKVVQTFSLLPGEKTTISIKTWRIDKTESAKTENILDSLSEDSQNTFEGQVENEFQTSMQTDFQTATAWASAHSEQSANSSSGSVGGGGSIDLAVVSFGGSAGYDWASSSATQDSNSTQGSASVSTANAASNLQKALDKHVNQSSSARKHEVNVESKVTASAEQGYEQTINRTLENINHSRVLNFVFRELNQEFLTIVYLKDVSFGFTKGVPGDGTVCKLDCLQGFLSQYLKTDNQVANIRNLIVGNLQNVYDHTGTPRAFVERVPVRVPSGSGSNGAIEFPELKKEPYYWRKNQNLQKDLTQKDAWQWKGKTVDGIILNTSSRILPTEAIIVDALLGQGEALDSYNMRLQNAADEKAELDNERSRAALAILQGSSIDELESRAEAFAKMFWRTSDHEHGRSE